MGKVRNLTIKKFGRSLVEKFPDKFTQDYAENKKVLDELAEITSKKLKNRIAGYVTSLVTRSPEIIHEPSKQEEIAEKAEKEESETKIKKQKKEGEGYKEAVISIDEIKELMEEFKNDIEKIKK